MGDGDGYMGDIGYGGAVDMWDMGYGERGDMGTLLIYGEREMCTWERCGRCGICGLIDVWMLVCGWDMAGGGEEGDVMW